MVKTKTDHITIDAKGRTPGRVATEVVATLTGKNTPAWRPNVLPDLSVTVINAGEVKMSASRLRSKQYRRHSGYPGNLKEESLERLFDRDPEEVVRRAVSGMLPKNKLRREALRRLTVKAGE